MIEVLPVRMAIDHRAGEPQLAHAALELVGGGFGVLHGKMGKAGIAVGAFADRACEEIIRLARLAARGCSILFRLNSRPGQSEHGAGDAGLVHGGKPHLAEIA